MKLFNKIEINKSQIKKWSIIGSRATFGLVLTEIADEIDNLIVLSGDVSTSAGLDKFRKIHKEKYLEMGIAEQNMLGVAAGLASEHYNVITTSFAPFQTMRCCEQIKVNGGYMKNKIIMVGLASGLTLGNLGYTHCCVEDIGVLRSIPNLTILSPCDPFELVKCLEYSIKHINGPTYIRLTGSTNQKIFIEEDYEFKIGKNEQLVSGKDVVIYSTGAIINEVIAASDILKDHGISASIINVSTIKPFNGEEIFEQIKNYKLVVSVEEHNVLGGLGSAISECRSKLGTPKKHLILGVNDKYSNAGSYNYLKNYFGIDAQSIAKKILLNL